MSERAQKIYDSLSHQYNEISVQQIDEVIAEYDDFESKQYAGKSLKERQELGQFFTPPELSIKMLDKFSKKFPLDCLFDPCVGAGGLLKAAILCGAVAEENCYGLEYDKALIPTTMSRLPKAHIKYGNALNSKCLSKDFFLKDSLEYIDEGEVGEIRNHDDARNKVKNPTGFFNSFGKI